jgi:nitrite reductase (NADH) small subunit
LAPLRTGEALGDDRGCTPTIPVKLDAGRIYLLREAVVAPAAA